MPNSKNSIKSFKPAAGSRRQINRDQIMAEMIDIGEQLCNGNRINALRQFHNLIRDLTPRRPLSLSKGSNRPPTT